MKALFDTNILIDYLNGIEMARQEIARYEQASISLVTWIEVLVGTTADEEPIIRGFLHRFVVLGIDRTVAEQAIALRKARRIKLPDAIVQATAIVEGAVLITRNTKDFPPDTAGIRIPYVLDPAV
ncbi:type II toxin-antitoxin system VapC family toxin [uncultured Thiocystis sp.]|uniref:type II toxin-antitoxin system VapC family toxin n=1 Tax=uncultured Thiocystis sp. TaxID=1202134 RepID=UPI00341D9D37